MAVRICPIPDIVKAKAVAKPEFGIRIEWAANALARPQPPAING